MTKAQDQEKADAIKRLKQILRPGDTVHTILRHVSRSGMQREIDLVKLGSRERQYHLSWLAAKAGGFRIGKRDGIVVGGCGMDMGFHLVYELSYVLFRNGWSCKGERCPSADHSNWRGEGHSPRGKGIKHNDGGYALRHRWL